MCQHRRNLGYVARLVQIVDDQGRNLAAAVDIQPVEAVLVSSSKSRYGF